MPAKENLHRQIATLHFVSTSSNCSPAAMRTPILKPPFESLPVALRGKRPKGAEHSPWESAGAPAHRAMGHSGVSRVIPTTSRRPGPSGYWPDNCRAARRQGMGQERARLSPRSEGDVRSRGRPQPQISTQDSARRRPDHPPRGAPRGRPQCISSRASWCCAPPAGRVVKIRDQRTEGPREQESGAKTRWELIATRTGYRLPALSAAPRSAAVSRPAL